MPQPGARWLPVRACLLGRAEAFGPGIGPPSSMDKLIMEDHAHVRSKASPNKTGAAPAFDFVKGRMLQIRQRAPFLALSMDLGI